MYSEKKLSIEGIKVARVVPEGSILCTCIASIGKNIIASQKCAFNQQINTLVPDRLKYDTEFLYSLSNKWSQQMKRHASEGTMQIVNKTEFSETTTWIPDLDEQTMIGCLFKGLDDLITLHQRL